VLLDGGRRRGRHRDGFEAFVEQVLCPTLSPGDVVILDNLSSHKGVRARSLVEARGATLLFLPPYSPDLNPIELAFSKLKQLPRSARHRSVDASWSGVQALLDRISAGDATNFIRHCGYTLQVE
jgi:transposase